MPSIHATLTNTIFYHVAHPDVPCKITGYNAYGLMVEFSEPVGFKSNHARGLQTTWACSAKLLYPTPDEAYKNSWAAKRGHSKARPSAADTASIWEHIQEE